MSRGYKCNQQNLQQRSLFLPIMICSKPSIKDVRLSHRRSASLCDDPLSPRVGCTGQVMRNSKVIGFPTPTKPNFTSKSTKSSTDCNNFMKYQKLKKFFSSKSLINSPTSFAVARAGANRTSKDDRNNDCCRGQRLVLGSANGSKFSTSDSCESNLINVADLDPPLPVTRRVRHPENESIAILQSPYEPIFAEGNSHPRLSTQGRSKLMRALDYRSSGCLHVEFEPLHNLNPHPKE
ncbi:hypothetical protein Nepgr_019276 [Nepenthes gracilis]|uniref:Uncharacterized protein n=1 Tax=Nepenthes gracilis TaxID=150966 RepID=A0AAD3ST87_NEPGR|nr:hypothetical protein Nepgr_019276 [Nepenthes gracilis]